MRLTTVLWLDLGLHCAMSMKYVNNFFPAPVVDTRFSEPFDLFCLQVVSKQQQHNALATLEQGGSVSVALVMVHFPFTTTGSAHFSTNTFSSNVSYPYANHFADRACEFLSSRCERESVTLSTW